MQTVQLPRFSFFDSTVFMKRLLIIQHENDSPPGTTLQWARLRNYNVEFWWPAQSTNSPSSSNFDLVVICGGGMDTFEEEKYPWLKNEKQFLRNLIQCNIKIFGLCLGSQLLAEILGGSVYKHEGWEIGFVPVTTKEGSSLEVFHWHQYTFALPPGAELIVQGEFCRNQAFKYGSNVIGTQFHPESTPEWIQECAEGIRECHQGLVQSKLQMLAAIHLQKNLQDWYFSRLDELASN